MKVYPEDFEERIDFSFIRNKLLSYCSFEIGRSRVEQMKASADYGTIVHELSQTDEMYHILTDASLSFPDGTKHNLSDALHRIRIEGMYLEEDELHNLRQTLTVVKQQSSFLSSLDKERFPLLSELPLQYPTQAAVSVVKSIDHLLDPYGVIKDNASPELSRIRREMRQAEGSVSRLLSQIMRRAQSEGYIDADTAPTVREGRLVLPVSPAYKKKITGIVHDESASGKTVYIEPTEVVEANNHIRELENEERREKIRLLQQIATTLRPLLEPITDCMQLLGATDFLSAKAKLARELGAIAPVVENRQAVDWREARHPVLFCNFRQQGKQVVPLDIALGEDRRILIISGPNAGGKSVCLKTVALLQYMMQCGLMVPLREDSTMGVFDKMMIDIGDSQSIENDLSTYSSHLRNMKYFLRNADESSLVLIDEFGGGTEPLIGGAIAEATLLRLNRQLTWGVITTHYTNLKHLAQQTEGLINGAMLYDRGQLRPLFQLSIGQAGSSFALEIAHSIGLPEDIIATAKELVGDEKIDYDKHLQDIARDKRYWENKRQQVRQKEKQLEERIAHYEEQLSTIKQKRREMLDEAKREAQELLERSNATIENTIRQIKESQADKQKTRAAREQVEQLRQTVNSTGSTEKRKKKKGQSVQTDTMPTANAAPKKNGKQVMHDFTELRSLTKSPTPTRIITSSTRQPSTVTDELRRRKLSFRQEIDLRGMRVDEALQAIESYIDDAVMVGTESVRIIHGTGTGAIKQVVRAYLAQNSRVSEFHDGDPDKGGAGITIVEF